MFKNAHECRSAICVHGAGGGWEWSIWQRVFASRGWSTLAPDLRPTKTGLCDTQLNDYVNQVVAWTKTRPQAPILIGASMGGLLALSATMRCAPAALVVINAMPPANILPRLPSRTYADIVAWGSARSLTNTRRAMPDVDDAACLYASRRWRDESGAVLNAAMRGIEIKAPNCPTLVIASELDVDIPLTTSMALAHWLGAELLRMKHASHLAPLLGKVAAECAEHVLEWCQRHEGLFAR